MSWCFPSTMTRKPLCKHITSYFPAPQVISVIRPPGLSFVYYPKDFRFLRYSTISSSLTVSMMYCSSLTTRSRSFGR